MAKKGQAILIRLVSTAVKENGRPTGYFKVIKKNVKQKTEKFKFRMFDPVVRRHVEFIEKKIK